MLKVLTDSSVFIGTIQSRILCRHFINCRNIFCEMAISVVGAISRKERFQCAKELSSVLRFYRFFKDEKISLNRREVK